jgi:type I restriction enzyme S subunit
MDGMLGLGERRKVSNEPLKNIAEITMGLSPKGDTYNDEGNGLPLLNGPTEFGETYPNCTLYTTDSKRECKKGDIIFCVRGSTTGRMNWADKKYSLGRGVCLIRGESLLDTRFIRYCLELKLNALLKNAGGGTFPNLRRDDLLDFKLPYPTFRNKIASILSAYDDQIENNNRRIKILEEMAQMIYREWFINFRFPGHEKVKMVKSAFRMIPEGWEVKKVGELLRKINRKPRIKKEDYLKEGDIPTIDQSTSFIGGYTNDTEALYETPLPIVVFGDHTRIVKYIDFPFASGADGTQLLYPEDEELMPAYFFYAINNIDLTNFAYARHFKFLKAQDLLVPSGLSLNKFNEIAGSFLKQKSSLRKKIDNLRKTRDLLLPKLISGEIDVEEMETIGGTER